MIASLSVPLGCGWGVVFCACVLLVVSWAPTYFIFRDLNTWQLVINTETTIVTFLLVGLFQNSKRRREQAVNTKPDALADGLAELMHHVGGHDPALQDDIEDLHATVAVERVDPREAAGLNAMLAAVTAHHG